MVGIDKIVLHTREFQVDRVENSGLRLASHEIDLNTGVQEAENLFMDSLGVEVKGQKAYANIDGLYTLDIDSRGMVIRFNPSKYFHPYNLTNNPNKYQEVWGVIQKDLKSKGIIGNWHHSNITRLDLAKNITLNNPCFNYTPVFNLLDVKRTKSPKIYPDGYASGNKSKGNNFYNKGRELKDESLGDNTMRGEIQFKKKASVRSGAKIYTLKNIFDSSPTDLVAVYNKDMIENVFRNKDVSTQKIIPFSKVDAMFKEIIEEHGKRNAPDKLKAIWGVLHLMKEQSIVGFEAMLEGAGYSRQAIHANKEKLTKEIEQATKLQGKRTTIGTMYRELFTKFAS